MSFFNNMDSNDKLIAIVAISIFTFFGFIMICVTLIEIFG